MNRTLKNWIKATLIALPLAVGGAALAQSTGSTSGSSGSTGSSGSMNGTASPDTTTAPDAVNPKSDTGAMDKSTGNIDDKANPDKAKPDKKDNSGALPSSGNSGSSDSSGGAGTTTTPQP